MSIYYVRLTQVHQIHGAVVVIILTPRNTVVVPLVKNFPLETILSWKFEVMHVKDI